MAVVFAFIVSGCFGLPKHVESSMVVDAGDSRDELALAATCLENGQTQEAIDHLSAHVQQFPDHVTIRSLLAEQYLKLGQTRDARVHVQRLLDDWQEDTARNRDQLVTCHTRLMKIAHEERDEFAESYHRGMGLLLVLDGEDHDRVLLERTLTQAISHFRTAQEHRSNDPRLNLALGDVLARLGQHSAARTAYRIANAAPPSSFTSAERMRLAKIEE